VRGTPSAEEMAALVAVLSARTRSAGAARSGETGRSSWSARSRLLREPIARAPGGWRASALPR
jgi:Acyl-CoA carboxylase epsilon subunit